MGQLNTEAAACIQFAYLDGLTFSEIAAQIERSLGTVKSWIRRGLDKLKACMQA
jgi:RNA polymerase sigma-70 factor (ECF subfamily)